MKHGIPGMERLTQTKKYSQCMSFKATCLVHFDMFDSYRSLYKGHHNGDCLAYIGNTSNIDSNHYGSHCMLYMMDGAQVLIANLT